MINSGAMPSNKKKASHSEQDYAVGERVLVNLHTGRIVDGTIRAIIERTDGKRLQVDFGKDETALIHLWQVVEVPHLSGQSLVAPSRQGGNSISDRTLFKPIQRATTTFLDSSAFKWLALLIVFVFIARLTKAQTTQPLLFVGATVNGNPAIAVYQRDLTTGAVLCWMRATPKIVRIRKLRDKRAFLTHTAKEKPPLERKHLAGVFVRLFLRNYR